VHACLTQHLADRLDSEPASVDDTVAVAIDVVDDHSDRDIADYLILGSSSAAAKNAADVFKISFARRSSRTSRSSSTIRVASSVVVPGRRPPSTSAYRTQPRRVSGCMPSCSATLTIAPDRVAGSLRASTAIRVARSRNSSGNYLGAAMTLILHGLRASIRPGAIHPEGQIYTLELQGRGMNRGV
jgi:hypothetical protein